MLLRIISILITITCFTGGILQPVAAQDDDPQTWNLVDLRLIGDEMWQQIGEIYPDFAPLDETGKVQGKWYTLLLSPDGSILVGAGKADAPKDRESPEPVICRYGIDSHEALCTLFDLRQISWLSTLAAAWSPDGTRIVFHEDAFARQFVDSDIWLLDVETLALTSLTDDEQSGNWLDIAPAMLTVDFAPMWSPTGDLYFFRMTYQGDYLVSALYRMLGGTHTPEHVVDLPGDYATFFVFSLAHAAISPDGSHIALLPFQRELPQSRGVWLIDLTGDEAALQSVATPLDLQVGTAEWSEGGNPTRIKRTPRQIAWNADGTQLLIDMYAPANETMLDNTNYVVIDVPVGEGRPLFDFAALSGYDALLEIEETLPGVCMLAPDRQTLIYVSRLAGDPRSLYVLSLAGDAPTKIGTLSEAVYEHLAYYQRQSIFYGVWGQSAENGRILYGDVLLTFESSER